MEPILVNHIRITPELFQESFGVVFDKRKQKTLLLCGIVFAVFGLIFLLIQYFLRKIVILGGPILIMGLFVIGWSFLLPRSECKRKYKALCQKNGGEPVDRTIEFYESGLTVHTKDGASIEIDYSEVREWRETKHLVLLICEDCSGILLDKTSFQSEMLEQIKELVQQRKEWFPAEYQEISS